MTDAAYIAALEAYGEPTAVLTTLHLPERTVRLIDGGFLKWDGETWRLRDAECGMVATISSLDDGVGAEAGNFTLSLAMPDMESLLAFALDPAKQGSVVTIHLATVDRETGLLIGEPDLLFRGLYDRPEMGVGEGLTLDLECVTEEAKMLQANDDLRLTDAFHQSVWPGELFYVYVTGVRRKVYWRTGSPSNAIT